MNLVEQKQKLIDEQKKFIEKRETLISQLREVEMSIERYNGAIFMANEILNLKPEQKTGEGMLEPDPSNGGTSEIEDTPVIQTEEVIQN